MAEILHDEMLVDNPDGRAPVLLICDHASNFIPARYCALGLDPELLGDHFAWDIGARALAMGLSAMLDAPLVSAPVSRLLIDPNRGVDGPDLIPTHAEGHLIPANSGLSVSDRQARLDAFHEPFHAAIDAVLTSRHDIASLVSIHSFAPRLNGIDRPWQVGILHAEDSRLADRLVECLSAHCDLVVGRNQPYAPEDGVYYTLERHSAGRATAMIEVRNDQLRDDIGLRRWTALLANAVEGAIAARFWE